MVERGRDGKTTLEEVQENCLIKIAFSNFCSFLCCMKFRLGHCLTAIGQKVCDLKKYKILSGKYSLHFLKKN